MKRESFVFYASWLDAIKNLPRDMQGEVLVAIVEYGIAEEMSADLKPITKALMAMVKPQIDINRARYENGKRGGRKVNEEPNHNQTETKSKPNNNQNLTKTEPNLTKPEPNVNDNVNDNDIKENNKKKNVRFSPPTIEEIQAYIQEKGYCRVKADDFFDYYESNGWMVGKNKMKKWQNAVSKWERTAYIDAPKAEVGMVLREEPGKYDNDEELWK